MQEPRRVQEMPYAAAGNPPVEIKSHKRKLDAEVLSPNKAARHHVHDSQIDPAALELALRSGYLTHSDITALSVAIKLPSEQTDEWVGHDTVCINLGALTADTLINRGVHQLVITSDYKVGAKQEDTDFRKVFERLTPAAISKSFAQLCQNLRRNLPSRDIAAMCDAYTHHCQKMLQAHPNATCDTELLGQVEAAGSRLLHDMLRLLGMRWDDEKRLNDIVDRWEVYEAEVDLTREMKRLFTRKLSPPPNWTSVRIQSFRYFTADHLQLILDGSPNLRTLEFLDMDWPPPTPCDWVAARSVQNHTVVLKLYGCRVSIPDTLRHLPPSVDTLSLKDCNFNMRSITPDRERTTRPHLRHIYSDLGNAAIVLALAEFAGCLETLSVTSNSMSNLDDSTLQQLLPHLAQCRSLMLTCAPGVTQQAFAQLPASAPYLQELCLRCFARGGPLSNFPQLHTLYLNNSDVMDLRAWVTTCRNLERVIISSDHPDFSPDPTPFVGPNAHDEMVADVLIREETRGGLGEVRFVISVGATIILLGKASVVKRRDVALKVLARLDEKKLNQSYVHHTLVRRAVDIITSPVYVTPHEKKYGFSVDDANELRDAAVEDQGLVNVLLDAAIVGSLPNTSLVLCQDYWDTPDKSKARRIHQMLENNFTHLRRLVGYEAMPGPNLSSRLQDMTGIFRDNLLLEIMLDVPTLCVLRVLYRSNRVIGAVKKFMRLRNPHIKCVNVDDESGWGLNLGTRHEPPTTDDEVEQLVRPLLVRQHGY